MGTTDARHQPTELPHESNFFVPGRHRTTAAEACLFLRRKLPFAKRWPNAFRSSNPSTRSGKTAIPGLYELRVNGSEIYYTDAQGRHIIQGEIIDTQTMRNLTEERVNKITAGGVRPAALQRRLHHCARRRQTQDGRVRRPQLRLLQAF